jgi:alpha-L-fucosidase
VKRETIFVHVFEWPAAALGVPGLKRKVISARLLATGQPLKFQQSETGLQIELPGQPPDPNVSVIALRTL